jgi:hypothetical protein
VRVVLARSTIGIRKNIDRGIDDGFELATSALDLLPRRYVIKSCQDWMHVGVSADLEESAISQFDKFFRRQRLTTN